MASRKNARPAAAKSGAIRLQKAPTGIAGLDEITGGGLPRGRPTLVCGAAGCGKTMLALEFLVRGATQFGESGVFMMFEESAAELAENVASLGVDLNALVAQKKIALDFVHVERREIEETGDYDLEGLFVRLQHAITSVGAKRVVLDTIEALFSGLSNEAILRAELRRLFRWLKDNGMTAIVTGERGDKTLTRYGLEEYVADCVILLDHRVTEEVSTRRLRVVKYRGSAHGSNEYPFLIGSSGFSVLPITSLKLDHAALPGRISSGIPGLDDLLARKGFFRGSSILISGSPGTGKSSLGVSFAAAACARGERAVIFAFEESESQMVRNMRSIGIDLQQWLDQGLLVISASRPTIHGLEEHLMLMHQLMVEFKPSVVVVDPISNLTLSAGDLGLKPTLMRLIDFLKHQAVTALFTDLTSEGAVPLANSQIGVSSLMDSWILLSNLQINGERNRTIQVLKSRGMNHSNQVREFVIGTSGIGLIDVIATPSGPLTGTARVAEIERRRRNALEPKTAFQRLAGALSKREELIEARIALLQAELALEHQFAPSPAAVAKAPARKGSRRKGRS